MASLVAYYLKWNLIFFYSHQEQSLTTTLESASSAEVFEFEADNVQEGSVMDKFYDVSKSFGNWWRTELSDMAWKALDALVERVPPLKFLKDASNQLKSAFSNFAFGVMLMWFIVAGSYGIFFALLVFVCFAYCMLWSFQRGIEYQQRASKKE